MYNFTNNKNLTKYHKIRNVEKSVCTAESKIAYNYAFSLTSEIKKDKFLTLTGIQKSDIIQELCNRVKTCIINDYTDFSKYSIDYILSCFRYGIEEYITMGKPILTSYKQIGKIFKSCYL